MQRNYRNLLTIILLIFFSFSSAENLNAQLGLNLDFIKPVDKLGQNFAPGPGISLRYSIMEDRFDSWVVGALTLGIFTVKPHQDTLYNNYSFRQPTGDFFGGYTVYEPYTYISFGAEGNFYPFPGNKVKPFFILALNGNTVTMKYDKRDANQMASVLLAENSVGGGVGAGVAYKYVGNFDFRLTVTKFWNFGIEQGSFSYWKTSLGAFYYW